VRLLSFLSLARLAMSSRLCTQPMHVPNSPTAAQRLVVASIYTASLKCRKRRPTGFTAMLLGTLWPVGTSLLAERALSMPLVWKFRAPRGIWHLHNIDSMPVLPAPCFRKSATTIGNATPEADDIDRVHLRRPVVVPPACILEATSTCSVSNRHNCGGGRTRHASDRCGRRR
jgi:hypothetical protein